ncbi:hypothetical protein EVAR_30002_1 [Eumeta japonica]|uniref:Uncharacterized protein n=1 Tax=Eumeta variegata TaxID=151549 RepID=A0A4C1VVZ0_EUMVA|nr:hypothetical protein EVAR_30002_1 [Eumeta japonica]
MNVILPNRKVLELVIGRYMMVDTKIMVSLKDPSDVTIRPSGGARRRRRRRPPTAPRLKGPRKQKSFAYKLLKRGLAKSFAYKLLKRGLANLMSPTSTSGVAPPLIRPHIFKLIGIEFDCSLARYQFILHRIF